MAEESVLSLEETNKKRVELGLRPIPVPEFEPKAQDEETEVVQTDESSLSIEATNKIRISLGLRPIPSESETVTDQDTQAVANWQAKESADKAAAQAEEITKRIQAARERTERAKLLESKSLGQADENEDDDVRKWVKRSKKRKVQEEQEEQEERQEYTADDLRGLKVGHQLEDIVGFDDEDVILTLKDRDVLDDGEDELISSALQERHKTLKNIENRKRKARYTGLEDDSGEPRGILSRYDDEESEENSKFFTLDSDVISVGAVVNEREKQRETAMHPNQTKVSLDVQMPDIIAPASDYMPPEPVKMRKPKKAKKSKSRTREVDEDAVMVDYGQDNIENDDEDLQALLAKQRRLQQLKRKTQILTPEMLAETIIEEQPQEEAIDGEGLVIDDMTEFVSTIGSTTDEEQQQQRRIRTEVSPDVQMPDVQPAESEEPEEGEAEEEEQQVTGLEEEAAVSSVGLGATLNLLRSRGQLKQPDEQDLERQKIQRENSKWKASMARRRALSEMELKRQREADRKSGKYDGLTQKEREEASQRENQSRQLAEAREAQRRFKDYKPDIKIEYKDEFGRSMNQKEAFKHLSHQFHGKGSGKGKTEKLLKKIEEERKRESKSFFN
ncbi:SART-1 protein [Lipomyces arxii]|uniref:SART-1 protein n=1 Tax=Lipomyces arxii TaxID=56418 RepID=UPI0034CE39B4